MALVLLAVGFVVLLAVYLVDVRVHPDAGGGRLRYSLRWVLTVVAAVLLVIVGFGSSAPGWLRVAALVTAAALVLMIYRGLGTGRRPQDRSRARYRSVRDQGTGVDGWRGD